MGNPLPAEIFQIYTESNGLQKLLTYFLDSLPSSLNGITNKNMFFFLFIMIAMSFYLLSNTFSGINFIIIIIIIFYQYDMTSNKFTKVSKCIDCFAKRVLMLWDFGFDGKASSFKIDEWVRSSLFRRKKNKRETERARFRDGKTTTLVFFPSRRAEQNKEKGDYFSAIRLFFPAFII